MSIYLPGNSDAGLGPRSHEIAVQPIEVDGRKDETQRVDEHPQQIDYVVAVRRLDERAGRSRRCTLHVIGQRAGDERRPQIDGDGREPDH